MSLRILIECIFKLSVHYVEGIVIVDATRMWHKLGLWLRKGRSGIICSSLLVWKRS
jgi:hypothetical protein